MKLKRLFMTRYLYSLCSIPADMWDQDVKKFFPFLSPETSFCSFIVFAKRNSCKKHFPLFLTNVGRSCLSSHCETMINIRLSLLINVDSDWNDFEADIDSHTATFVLLLRLTKLPHANEQREISLLIRELVDLEVFAHLTVSTVREGVAHSQIGFWCAADSSLESLSRFFFIRLFLCRLETRTCVLISSWNAPIRCVWTRLRNLLPYKESCFINVNKLLPNSRYSTFRSVLRRGGKVEPFNSLSLRFMGSVESLLPVTNCATVCVRECCSQMTGKLYNLRLRNSFSL